MKRILLASTLLTGVFMAPVQAADYVIDTKGAHASINFTASHMGFSALTGRFNTFSGKFSFDPANIGAATITVKIDPSSVDSNHAERDKHLRSDDFLDTSKFKTAKFVSTKITDKGDDKLAIAGDFTLHGVTKSIVIDAVKVGEGDDPWGGYRLGFSGTTKIAMADYGFKMNFGEIELVLHIEGVRQ